MSEIASPQGDDRLCVQNEPSGLNRVNRVPGIFDLKLERMAKGADRWWSGFCARRMLSRLPRWPSDTGSASRRSTRGKRYGTLEVADVRRLRELEAENARLKKMLAERDLEIDVMKEISKKKW